MRALGTLEDDSEQAINRVLEAERAAGEMRSRCQNEAMASLEAARSRARHIHERADARIARVRAACEAHAAARVAELERAAQELLALPADEDERHARLEPAVDRLAAALTGEGSDAA
jgi:hypothetical protein